jgi:hypothetical protein
MLEPGFHGRTTELFIDLSDCFPLTPLPSFIPTTTDLFIEDFATTNIPQKCGIPVEIYVAFMWPFSSFRPLCRSP